MVGCLGAVPATGAADHNFSVSALRRQNEKGRELGQGVESNVSHEDPTTGVGTTDRSESRWLLAMLLAAVRVRPRA
jgi:hypothetical protein